jgi:hypothetical protein
MDPVAELASRLNRPAASLAAFSRVGDEHLRTLAAAIDAVYDRRQREVDAQLERTFRSPLIVRLLRGRAR